MCEFRYLLASSESFANGKSYSISAEVGLLTRNIKIVGEEYATIGEEAFGARVLVGVTADATRAYTGIFIFYNFSQVSFCDFIIILIFFKPR